MAKEIEHKYLVVGQRWKQMSTHAMCITQGYLCRDPERTVRVRLIEPADSRKVSSCPRAVITIKGKNHGATRLEMEYEIPADDARQLLALCPPPLISKTRHIIPFDGYKWEVDQFHGHLEGLVMAEIELPTADARYTLPPFVAQNVTNDPRYYNSNLIDTPPVQ